MQIIPSYAELLRTIADGGPIIAGTGHRPEKLGGFGPEINRAIHRLATRWLLDHRPGVVISGMALGWDQCLAHAAADLGIPFIAAVPFKGQELVWPATSQKRYHAILRRARDVIIVSEGGFSRKAMQVRNEFMVDLCDRLAALWDGSPGGTANCIRYALQREKPYDNLWSEYTATLPVPGVSASPL